MVPAPSSKLIQFASSTLLNSPSKKLVLSGPSGFVGSRVLESILQVHELRKRHGLKPGELVLLSYSPGKLMDSLSRKYGRDGLKTVRASRVDYYTQHDQDTWIDHLGSLGLEGEKCVFINLAAVAGPEGSTGKTGLGTVNYLAPLAASKACEQLGFSHWIQSSTQATNAERAGQVPYSRGKAMADFALSRMTDLPVTIASIGLLYCGREGLVGQRDSVINLADLALLPLTPILGSGAAPLQPQEVEDAAQRLVFLAMTDPKLRPPAIVASSSQSDDYLHTLPVPRAASSSSFSPSSVDSIDTANNDNGNAKNVNNLNGSRLITQHRLETLRRYDAVGPETMSMIELLQRFARYQGNKRFRPVHIGYANMEKILEKKSLGNLNRQFVSLLRSEQESEKPILGDCSVWESLLGKECTLTTLDEAFFQQSSKQSSSSNSSSIQTGSSGETPSLSANRGGLAEMEISGAATGAAGCTNEKKEAIQTEAERPATSDSSPSSPYRRQFPIFATLWWAWKNPGVIWPGIKLSIEIIESYIRRGGKYAPPPTRASSPSAASTYKSNKDKT